MRWSQAFIPTKKEVPRDAEVISHILMLRAGMIRKVASGVYTYLPMSLTVLGKISDIIRRQMNKRGAQEVSMPVLAPAELWRESGRWDLYGRELMRLVDRHDRDYILGPTHEEVVTDLVRQELSSYRQLPINLYQIQTKMRDEIRPRFGLMRGREFIMKDGYSFDRDNEGAENNYRLMYEGYNAIFDSMGLKYVVVEADSGAIGGSFSHEYMVLADTGEDLIVYCTDVDCGYAANQEKAFSRESNTIPSGQHEPKLALEEVHTPRVKTIEQVSGFLRVKPTSFIKTLAYIADGEPVMALVRGDYTLNEVKLKNQLSCDFLEMASDQEIKDKFGSIAGFMGPVGVSDVKIVADYSIVGKDSMISGANRADYHLKNINYARDIKPTIEADIRSVEVGETCPRCRKAKLDTTRGIEVGHIFKLGTKYSDSMKVSFLDEDGKSQVPIMGCYGIGVGRTMAAAIEQNHDKDGIIWPQAIAPFLVLVTVLGSRDEETGKVGHDIWQRLLELELEPLLDDRDERPGVKFKDADLIGIPLRITVGKRSLDKGVVSIRIRATGEEIEVPPQEAAEEVKRLLAIENKVP